MTLKRTALAHLREWQRRLPLDTDWIERGMFAMFGGLMKRVILVLVVVVALCGSGVGARPGADKPKPPCAPSLASCPDEGCGAQFDSSLNRRKNIRSDSRPAVTRTLAWIKKLDDPENFSENSDRDELADLGEGEMIAVTAYLIDAKAELGGESCNCGLHTPEETDNHLVLVSKTTVDKFPLTASAATNKARFHSRELQSITAEFTPRVRLDHPNFTREALLPLIKATKQKALLVRVTGLLLFDSEHFLRNHLVRVTNWEIHPVLKLEYCVTTTCKPNSNANWKSLDDL